MTLAQTDHQMIDANYTLIVEIARIARRLETELDWNLRLKVERLGRLDREKDT